MKKKVEKENLITALYCRLSVDDIPDADAMDSRRLKEELESNSITHQKQILEDYCKKNGIRNYRFFADDGISGTTFNRPDFKKMDKMIESGEIGTVIVKDLSRFGRDHVMSGYYLQIKYPSLGVNFISLQENVDIEKDMGTDMLPIHNVFNEWYAQQTSKKIRAVWQNKRDRGERVSPTVPYGYKKAKKDTQWYIDEPAAEVVRYIFKMAMEGLGPTKIANRLREEKYITPTEYFYQINRKTRNERPVDPYNWQNTTVKHILDNPQYTGCTVNGRSSIVSYKVHKKIEYDESEWQIIPNCHEAIVSESEYEEAQKVFRKIRKGYDRSPDQYQLRSLVHCGACGRTMQRQKHSPVIYYTCLKSVSNRETACPVGERFIEADLERIVKNDLLEKLRLLVDVDDRLYAAAAASEGTEENNRFRLEQIEKRMKQISVSRVSAYERYAEGRLQRDIYLMERDKLNAENDRLSAEKERLEKGLLSLSQSRNRELTETCDMARRTLTADELTNEMLLFFIDRVNVYSGMRVEIIYHFSDEIARLIEQENTAE